MGADVTTLNENTRAPLDGTEYIRLATTGLNWKAQVNQPGGGSTAWPFGTVAGGTAANSSLTLESTTGTGTSDAIFFKTAAQVERFRLDNSGNLTSGGNANVAIGGSQHVIQIICDSSVVGHYASISLGANAGGGGYAMAKTRGSTPTTQTILAASDNIGGFHMFGSDGAAFQEGASFRAFVDGTPAANSMPMRWIAATTPSGATAAVEAVRIDSSQCVVVNSGGNGNIFPGRVESVSDSSTTWQFDGIQLGANTAGAGIALLKTRATSSATQTAVVLNDILGVISFRGSDGTAFRNSAVIQGLCDIAPANSSTPGRLSFGTTPAGTSQTPIERHRIDSTGTSYFDAGGIMSGNSHCILGAGGTLLGIYIQGTNAGDSLCRGIGWGATVPPAYYCQTSASTTIGTHSAVAANQLLGALEMYGDDGTTFQRAGMLRAFVGSNTPSAGHVSGRFSFFTSSTTTNDVEIMQVLDTGVVNFLIGQLQFPSTQNASANVNTLDDYHEGTFTPTIGGTATYSLQEGRYVKIGNHCYIEIRIIIAAGGIGSGSATILSGLPFTSTSSVIRMPLSLGYFAALATSVVSLYPEVIGNSTTLQFSGLTAAGTSMTAPVTVFTANTEIHVAGWYETAN